MKKRGKRVSILRPLFFLLLGFFSTITFNNLFRFENNLINMKSFIYISGILTIFSVLVMFLINRSNQKSKMFRKYPLWKILKNIGIILIISSILINIILNLHIFDINDKTLSLILSIPTYFSLPFLFLAIEEYFRQKKELGKISKKDLDILIYLRTVIFVLILIIFFLFSLNVEIEVSGCRETYKVFPSSIEIFCEVVTAGHCGRAPSLHRESSQKKIGQCLCGKLKNDFNDEIAKSIIDICNDISCYKGLYYGDLINSTILKSCDKEDYDCYRKERSLKKIYDAFEKEVNASIICENSEIVFDPTIYII